MGLHSFTVGCLLKIFTFCSSCSGWSAPCPSNQLCVARVWTTSSSAATVKHGHHQPSSLHLHLHCLLPLSPSPPWHMSALPPSPHPSVPTLHCHHTLHPSVLLSLWPPRPSQSPRPSQCNHPRHTVSRSMSSVGPPAASDANTWSKVGQLCSTELMLAWHVYQSPKVHQAALLFVMLMEFVFLAPMPWRNYLHFKCPQKLNWLQIAAILPR